jgi:uncharacterized protein involved in outer membrane biogenesis
METGLSFVLGRNVSLKGPITLTFSLSPTLILEDVRIANPSWASHPLFLKASRLEAQLALLPLIDRRLVVHRFFFDGVELHLEEGPNEINNWTFGQDSKTSPPSETKSDPYVSIPEDGYGGFQRVTISYQPYGEQGPEDPTQLTIIEATILPLEDRFRTYAFRGTFRDVLFSLELTGGKAVDLLNPKNPWPFDGKLTAGNTTLKAKGQLQDSENEPYLQLTGSLVGEDLSSLNPLLQIDLPPYGPYELITSLSLSEHQLQLSDSQLKVGQTDLAGLFIMDFKEDRTHYYSRLTGDTLQIKDFQSTEPENDSASTSPPSLEPFSTQTGIDDIDVDLELTVNTFLVDKHNLGRIALSAKLKEGHLSVSPFRAETFGGVISGSFELDGNHPAPKVSMEVTAQDWNYGQALKDLGVTSQITGSTDLDATIRGQGATLQEFLDHSTLSIHAGPSSLMFGNEENSDKVVLGIRKATVKATTGGAVKARVKGEFKKKVIDVVLVTGSLAQLATPDKPWPISLLARSDDAALTIKGRMRSEAEGMRVVLAASLQGQQLNRLDPDLPSSGPYVFKAQLLNSGRQYFLKDLKGRVGQSDLTGFVSLNMEKDIPHLSAVFSSSYLDMADLSTPSGATLDDILIPVESLQALDAEITWEIKRIRAERVQLRDLTVDGNLKNGRLAFTTLKGNLVDGKHTYAEFQGELALDTTADIPTLSGKTLIHNLDYGHLLKRFRSNGQLFGVANLDAHFSSKGNTLFTMLTQSTFKIGTQDLRITLNDQQDEREPFLNVTQAALSSKSGGPLLFSAEGSFEEKPFTITSSSGDLSQLIKDIHQWPVAMAIQFPRLLIDLKGHLLFPVNGEDFSFQVLVKGDSWKELPFLTEMEFSDLGPFALTGLLTQIKEGYRVTELKGQWGPNDMAGHLTFMTNGPRPKLVATLRSETNEFSFLTKALSPPVEPEDGTILMNIVGSAANIGAEAGRSIAGIASKAGDVVTESLGVGKIDDENETQVARIIPDFEFPVDLLRSIDLDLDWQIQKVESKGIHLGNLSYKLTLEDGLLTLGPLKGTMWHGAIDSRIELDASQYVPTLTAQLTIQDLDLEFLDDTVGVTDLVKGEIDLIKLNLRSRGTTLHEVLSRANGEAELVEGPLEITNEYIDLWAADIFTLTLSKVWEKEDVTKINCAVGYFDIVEGEIQSDAILFDTKRITVGGFGTLNLSSEKIDLILTPQPKNPTLVSLGTPVRISGYLSDPDVTSDKLRIAQGGAWYLLGLINPIGLVVVIPKIAGTTLGTGKQNPCAAAMLGKEFTVQEVSELQESFWDWMVRKMKGAFSDNDDSIHAPPKNKSSAQ